MSQNIDSKTVNEIRSIIQDCLENPHNTQDPHEILAIVLTLLDE